MINIVIPMAGLGTRFQKIGIDKPKPLIVVNGKTLIEHSIDSFNVKGKFIFITRDFDDSEVVHISKEYQKQIDDLINHNGSVEDAKKLKKEIKELRTIGLEKGDGEYSVGNLVFKKLRNTGCLGRLFDYYNQVEDKNLSLECIKTEFDSFFNTSL